MLCCMSVYCYDCTRRHGLCAAEHRLSVMTCVGVSSFVCLSLCVWCAVLSRLLLSRALSLFISPPHSLSPSLSLPLPPSPSTRTPLCAPRACAELTSLSGTCTLGLGRSVCPRGAPAPAPAPPVSVSSCSCLPRFHDGMPTRANDGLFKGVSNNNEKHQNSRFRVY